MFGVLGGVGCWWERVGDVGQDGGRALFCLCVMCDGGSVVGGVLFVVCGDGVS